MKSKNEQVAEALYRIADSLEGHEATLREIREQGLVDDFPNFWLISDEIEHLRKEIDRAAHTLKHKADK